MKGIASFVTFVALTSTVASASNFTLVADYSGNGFFDGWDFYGNYDNLTNGDVTYVNQTNATNLAYVTPSGTAIIKVDNTSFVPYNYKRNSVRITTQDYFGVGTVWLMDAAHIPFGCSVWPSIWTKGNDWPNNGEIDIIEGVNLMTYNQMALHTLDGCLAATGTDETGVSGGTNCSTPAGCTVVETKPNSYGQNFANAGGGVWATQFDVSGIFIWFWSRPDIPPSITTATDSLDISTWGPPSAAYAASTCNIPQFFGAQQIVLDITLCGDWAGLPAVYTATCGGDGSLSACYIDNVINNGTPQYADAYFEINYIRAFALNTNDVYDSSGNPVPSGSPSGSNVLPPFTTSASGAANPTTGVAGDTNTSGGWRLSPAGVTACAAGLVAALSWLLL